MDGKGDGTCWTLSPRTYGIEVQTEEGREEGRIEGGALGCAVRCWRVLFGQVEECWQFMIGLSAMVLNATISSFISFPMHRFWRTVGRAEGLQTLSSKLSRT